MKTKMSIKGRITLWYAALIVFICAAALFSLFTIFFWTFLLKQLGMF